jgi:hypothetical protein
MTTTRDEEGRELWTGEAVDQLLTNLGIELRTVRYQVVREEWDLSDPTDPVRTIIEIKTGRSE